MFSLHQHACICNTVDLSLKLGKEKGGKEKDDRASPMVTLVLDSREHVR